MGPESQGFRIHSFWFKGWESPEGPFGRRYFLIRSIRVGPSYCFTKTFFFFMMSKGKKYGSFYNPAL
ncbi:MAG: hypothetical protein A2Z51_00675 [Deltaproteobacteria bacterium RBG_19FT_COMBO_52_11]|nr:MAG: hypothetical protein A2Z51_00675 [Deltaproteobacteria bacterium RBG_19FT_COMBO_52_11]